MNVTLDSDLFRNDGFAAVSLAFAVGRGSKSVPINLKASWLHVLDNLRS